MSDTPTPDRDDEPGGDIARDIAREVAAIRAHLPAHHPLSSPRPAFKTPTRIVVYNDNGVDRAAIAVSAWNQLYTLAETTDGATVVVVTEDARDGSRRVVDAYQDGLPYRPPPEPAALPSPEVMRHQVDAQFAVLCRHLPAPLAADACRAVDDGDVEWTEYLADETTAGRLAFLTPTRRRGYVLDRDQDGRSFAQVTTFDPHGPATSASFRDGQVIAGIFVEPPRYPGDGDDIA